jgi:hypothetical protein
MQHLRPSRGSPVSSIQTAIGPIYSIYKQPLQPKSIAHHLDGWTHLFQSQELQDSVGVQELIYYLRSQLRDPIEGEVNGYESEWDILQD